jgi:mediator of RNA polymerase II transcription subunit 10
MAGRTRRQAPQLPDPQVPDDHFIVRVGRRTTRYKIVPVQEGGCCGIVTLKPAHPSAEFKDKYRALGLPALSATAQEGADRHQKAVAEYRAATQTGGENNAESKQTGGLVIKLKPPKSSRASKDKLKGIGETEQTEPGRDDPEQGGEESQQPIPSAYNSHSRIEQGLNEIGQTDAAASASLEVSSNQVPEQGLPVSTTDSGQNKTTPQGADIVGSPTTSPSLISVDTPRISPSLISVDTPAVSPQEPTDPDRITAEEEHHRQNLSFRQPTVETAENTPEPQIGLDPLLEVVENVTATTQATSTQYPAAAELQPHQTELVFRSPSVDATGSSERVDKSSGLRNESQVPIDLVKDGAAKVDATPSALEPEFQPTNIVFRQSTLESGEESLKVNSDSAEIVTTGETSRESSQPPPRGTKRSRTPSVPPLTSGETSDSTSHSSIRRSSPKSVPKKRPGRPRKSSTPAAHPLSKIVSFKTSKLPVDPITMAPVKDPNDVPTKIKDVIHTLYEVQSHTHGFVPETQTLLINKMKDLTQQLADLQRLTDKNLSPDNPVQKIDVAPEIVDYVDDGRNPDIFTRDFVELVQRGNAVMNGKRAAFRDFSQLLARGMKEGIGGVDKQVDMIMENAGIPQLEVEKKDDGKQGQSGLGGGVENGENGEKKA